MAKGFFITGTDTNAGKTWATLAMMHALQMQGYCVAGYKPVAAGCDWEQGGWKNQDAVLLQTHASVALNYRQINPYAFQQPVSPHIACANTEVDMAVLQQGFLALNEQCDCVLVEGAGGWLSPLSRRFDNADLAQELQLPVVMVVGMRLGCINHARLTYRAIEQSELLCTGWLAVQLEPAMAEFDANVAYLRDCLAAPLLGVLPYQSKPDFATLAAQLKIKP